MSIAVSRFTTDNLGDKIRAESRRITHILRFAVDESVITGQQIGLYIKEDQFHFLALNDNRKWAPIAEAGALKPGKVAKPLTISLLPQGFSQAPVAPEDENGVQPQAMIFPTGQVIPPFDLILKGNDEQANQPSAIISSDIVGDIQIELKL